MVKVLVACRAGVGSSLMLKIKLNEVIAEHKWNMEVIHSSLDELSSFDGPIVVTLSDVADELKEEGVKKEIVGIRNLLDKKEIYTKVAKALQDIGVN
ncbi:PTS ascorbate transporter subunit IIB [Lacticaseibacillus chiayiensis]|uniref:PTS ascorbate transporter subunit IIB n=1 Tax=Lacticaseibacillus chiayiensis TaxID=2100821 RepID=A0A4Q1U520_9LACO|nr:PTS sugar transporter subunit IIB [Lacticaseibacillus chiayiensis]QVI35074.1 PTS sugar transporter subunit IIB [Lacticaseibacillus chiayiensis]RXT26586.1 PTS ascorbate transporter subunit IIB [Lacticaseibacillus chiayiensis]UYN56856.1 PTS sugar transporter subunit IIB [Lacticaseibacillus chiayiensis]